VSLGETVRRKFFANARPGPTPDAMTVCASGSSASVIWFAHPPLLPNCRTRGSLAS
jgi:3-mercaptopyruvate sulfurtransferase SseA